MVRPFLYALLSALVTFSSARTVSAQQEPVTTFAAASLFDALNSIGKTFTNQTGVPVRFSFASSAVLAKQIDQGAPADVFASADVEWMDWAQARNLIKPQTRIEHSLCAGALAARYATSREIGAEKHCKPRIISRGLQFRESRLLSSTPLKT
jgi:ABC-type molybdate transport system substrate-binding protein